MTAQRLRAGLIGLGHMGRKHARTLRRVDRVELSAVMDPIGDPYGAAGGSAVYTDLEELLRHGIDYAVVACPTSLHADVGIRLAAAGIPALIEKPLAPDSQSAQRLIAAYRSAGVPAAVGYIERFNPALKGLRDRIQEGLLGDVFEINTRRTSPFPPRISDIGVIRDLATHDIDITSWITGQRYASITARTAHRSGRPHEDLLAAIAQLSDGTIAHHRANWLTPNPERVITATGEYGCLTADTLATSLTLHRNEPAASDPKGCPGAATRDATRYALPGNDPLLSEHRAFLDTVLGLGGAGASLDDGLHAALVADAATISSHTAQTTPIAWAAGDHAALKAPDRRHQHPDRQSPT